MRFAAAALALFALASSTAAQQAGADELPAFVPDEEHLGHIAQAGQLAGEIQACEFDWQRYYLDYMQSERRRASNDGYDRESEEYGQRIAFIGMFFGAHQGQTLSKSDGKPCSEQEAGELAERAAEVIRTARGREGEDG